MNEKDNIDSIRGFNRFTKNAKKIITEGYKVAKNYGYDEFKVIHIFYVLLRDKNNIVFDGLTRLGLDIDLTMRKLEELMTNETLGNVKNPKNINISVETRKLLNESFVLASELGHVYVGSEHLMLAMFKLENLNFIVELQNSGIDFESLKKIFLNLGNYQFVPFRGAELPFEDEFGDKDVGSLPYFCRDMNELAAKGKYPTITGRDKELKRLIHILSRKTKNNPILVGNAGVGKTAIVESFVNNMVAKKVPASFVNKRVMSLDVAAILAGARLRGDVEERITSIINDVLDEGDTILFIDEIHTIVGAGSSGNRDSMDIANILKPYLTSPELSIIGATTYDEYSKYFESDSALTRRFQPIFVDEIDIDSAKKILHNLKKDFENYHKVIINDDAIEEAVTLSSKFIQDRYLPDKAIDIIDEAAASIKIGREIAIEPKLSKLGEELVEAQNKKDELLNKGDYEKAAKFKELSNSLVNKIEDIIEGKFKVDVKYPKTVTVDLVRNIIVDWTKIPIVASDISDKRLSTLTSSLKKRVVGQDRVVEKVAKIIQKAHLGLSGDKRPLGSFLFLGPTGVGKTELAKALAAELFGTDDLIFQLNMSEFMEQHSVAKLIGAPPGYIGYQEGGQLTTYVKRKPYSVILFDEIEKAHPDSLNLLLQILEEGVLNDSKGNKVSFKNCIIIMTSNIGAEEISKSSKIGFDVEIEDFEKDEIDAAFNDANESIMETLRKQLRPEFINRIDLVEIFRGLNESDCALITKKLVDELSVRLISKGILMNVDNKVVDYINKEGYSKEYGGRNIRRKVQEILEDGLSSYLLSNNIRRKRKEMLRLNVNMKKGQVVFREGSQ